MKVDRSVFLVLAGALAMGGAACVVKEYQPPPPPPPAPPPPPPPAANNAPPHLLPLHAAAESTNNKTPPVAPSGSPHIMPLRPAPPPGPAPSPPPPAPAACLDSGGVSAPTCSAQLTSSCSGNAFPMQRCQTYLQYFDPKIGANAVNCMNGLGGNMCDSQHDYNCGKTALAQACPDQTVAQLCQIAAGSCKVTANDCVNMLSGLNTAGQDAVAQCVAGGCSAGLYSCIEGLGASSTSVHR